MAKEIGIKIQKLDEKAVIPAYAHGDGALDVGMDMTAIGIEYDEEHDMYIYHTGLAFEPLVSNVGQFLFVRSSNCKKECYLCNHVGIGDPSYRGEIQFRFKLRDSLNTMTAIECIKTNNYNFNEVYLSLKERAKNLEFAPYDVGDRVGQMVYIEYPNVKLYESFNLNGSIRGTGGFGHTGK